MSACNDKWLKVYAYVQRMAARAYPNDVEAAADIASDCFDRFVRLYADRELKDYHAWIGRSITGLKKNLERERHRAMSLDDDDLVFDHVYSTPPQQEHYYDAKVLRHLSGRLSEREQWAFEIIADGGNVKEIMDEMYIGPREALALLHQVRVKVSSDAWIPEQAWNQIVSSALSLLAHKGA